MSIKRGGYQGAKSCTGGPQPGAWGAMDAFLDAYRAKGGLNTGIHSCRNVRGGKTTSLHGEGRAMDFGVRPYSAKWGWELARKIVAYSAELEVQCVIWDRKIWSSTYPDAGFRKYSGVNPHRDHLHVELTWKGAKRSRSSAKAIWARHIGGAPTTPADPLVDVGNNALRLGSTGDRVASAQRHLGVTVTGRFDKPTEDAVKRLQARRNLTPSGIIDWRTWLRMFPAGAWLAVDGVLGPNTIRALQAAVQVEPTGTLGRDSVRAIQRRRLSRRLGHANGVLGRDTVRALQRHVGAPATGVLDRRTVRQVQRRLNVGAF